MFTAVLFAKIKKKKGWKSNERLSIRKWLNSILTKGYMSVEMEGVVGVIS